jgi:hypothetical protein
MANNDHNKAAELHEHAAKSHRAADEQHGKGDHRAGNMQEVRSSTGKVLTSKAIMPTQVASNRSN